MSLNPVLSVIPCTTFLLFSSLPALAQTTEETATLIESTEITSSATQEELPTTTTTDAETLENRFIRSFEDLSRGGEPGVNFNSASESINIRGLDGDRVLTTIDGIRIPWLNDAVRGVSGGLDAIDFNSLSSIDVIRGANSSQLGSGALGGALALRTLDPEDLLEDAKTFGSLLKSDYDTADDSWGLNAALAGRRADTLWLLQVGHRQGHEEETGGNDDLLSSSRTEANPADADQHSALFKLHQYLQDGHRLGLTAEWFEREEDIDSRINQGTANYPSHYDTRESNERKRVSFEHRYSAPDTAAIVDWAQSTAYWQNVRREDAIEATRAGTLAGPYGRNNDIEKEQYGLISSVGKRLGIHELTLGGEWSRITTEQYSAGYDACPSPLLAPPSTSYQHLLWGVLLLPEPAHQSGRNAKNAWHALCGLHQRCNHPEPRADPYSRAALRCLRIHAQSKYHELRSKR
jgi:hemoglobin/transferrin/lactoferrin receptor protein